MKTCAVCGRIMPRPYRCSVERWSLRTACSNKCAGVYRGWAQSEGMHALRMALLKEPELKSWQLAERFGCELDTARHIRSAVLQAIEVARAKYRRRETARCA